MTLILCLMRFWGILKGSMVVSSLPRTQTPLYYCKHCGYYASSAPNKLKAPCGGMSTQAKAMIARIQRGELPPGLKSWPSQKLGSAPNLIEL